MVKWPVLMVLITCSMRFYEYVITFTAVAIGRIKVTEYNGTNFLKY